MLPMGAIGALLGGLLAALGRWGTKQRAARVAFGLLISAVGAVLGVLGWIFVFLWAGTDHEVAYKNENILQCAPWALVLSIAAFRFAIRRQGGERAVFAASLLCLGTSAIGLVLKGLPAFYQVNGHIIALLLPVWAGITLGCLAYLSRLRVPWCARPDSGDVWRARCRA
jgi:hypothetical protein